MTTETCCPPPPAGVFRYYVCDFGNDGVEIIIPANLGVDRGSGFTSASFCGSKNEDIVRTYYLTENDATNSINQISGFSYAISSDLSIYNKIENVVTNEYNINSFEVRFVSCSGNDSDGDGIVDEKEDPNNDFIIGNDDTDQDGILNYLDDDDDGDGILTINEDSNNNGNPADDDVNSNGVPDYLEGDGSIELPIVNIPDPYLKGSLLYTKCVDIDFDGTPDIDADLNNDGEIQVSEALAVTNLIFKTYVVIFDITGLEAFLNLRLLDFDRTEFYDSEDLSTAPTGIDLTPLTKLEFLALNHLESVTLQNINLSGLENLNELDLLNIRPFDTDSFNSPNAFVNVNLDGCINLQSLTYTNSFLNFDFCQVPTIIYLDCSYLEGGEPEVFDFSCLTNLETLNIDENTVDKLILKNGSVLNSLPLQFGLYDFPNYLCVDNLSGETEILSPIIGSNTVVNSYCSNVPGGIYYLIEGNSIVDSNNDGCDVSDPVYPNLKVDVFDGNTNGIFIVDASGNYSIPLQEGTHTITPVLENPNYFTINPTSITVNFPTDSSPHTQDFCLTPIPGLIDLEVSVLPIVAARPGFDAKYKLIYKNKGTTTQSGTIQLHFNDDKLDFVFATPILDAQSTGLLSWNYSNILPFESRTIEFAINLNTPTDPSFPLNANDILSYTTTISPVIDDVLPDDNTFTLNQTVVNSFDPNDKTCLEGNTITPGLIGSYVHYLIRCENTGSADAVNVVIKDVIDTTKLDINSLIITDSSHSMETNISSDIVEFIFDNINMPFDDANNDGYVAFKIKTLPTLQVGDVFENDAAIFFDYNAPIATNIAQTSIENTLGLDNFNLFNNTIKLFPNPVNDTFFLESKEVIKSIVIYNISGSQIQNVSYIGAKSKIEISTKNLSQGTYFVKVSTDSDVFNKKLIKK